MRGVTKSERHAIALEKLDLVHMSDYRRRMPSQLSGGQQQRVTLGTVTTGVSFLVILLSLFFITLLRRRRLRHGTDASRGMV